MCIEDVGVAAVFVNGQILAVILEDVASSCCACTAYEARYMAAYKAFRNCLTSLLVRPGSTICQPQVKVTVTGCVTVRRSNLVQAATCPSAFLSLQCQINSRGCSCFIIPLIIAFCRLGENITLELNSACACLAIFDVNVDNTCIVSIQCVVLGYLGILFNIKITVHSNNAAIARINTVAFSLRRGSNSSVGINSNLTAYCINTLSTEACSIGAELQAVSLNGNILALTIAVGGSYCACNIIAFRYSIGNIQCFSVGINRNRTAA